jgi:hypothetical protein
MKLRIGTNHVVRCPDKVIRQYKVRDKRLHPYAKTVAICLFCKEQWPTEQELLAAHPETNIMVKQEEPHVWGYWSDDPVNPPDKTEEKPEAKAKKPEANGKADEKKFDPSNVLGFLSDEEVEQR